ncbi:MAG TPA: ATP-grasp domain-containing protein [Candidatus Paceibacterota bacterium]|nr:ATP-grasp domain-containing protein [Candidatus Paceibacterota bacterium]
MKDLSDLNIQELFGSIEKHTSFKDDAVVWLGLRAGDFSLISFIYPDGIASTRYGQESLKLENKYHILSTEKNTKIRTDSDLNELEPEIEEYLKSFGDHPTHLVCYHSTPFLEKAVQKYPNINILNPPARLKFYLDQKTEVRKKLKSRGVKVIPGIEQKFSYKDFDNLALSLGLPFVVSFDNSAAGYGVKLINDVSDFLEIPESNNLRDASFMKYIDGKSMSMSSVRTLDHVIFSEPSIQIIGQKECTKNTFGWCGNDFNISNKISYEEIEKMKDMSKKIGNWLGEIGYYGIYGVDFISDEEEVYFTELNPRFLGTSSLLVDRQTEIGKIPLSFFHLVPFLNGASLNDVDFVNEYNKITHPLNVSQLVLHNLTGKDCIIESSLLPGRYSFEEGRLIYLGPETCLSSTKSYDEIVVTGDVPVDGTKVLRNADELCKILTYNESLDDNCITLNPYIESLVNTVYSKFKLIKNEKES